MCPKPTKDAFNFTSATMVNIIRKEETCETIPQFLFNDNLEEDAKWMAHNVFCAILLHFVLRGFSCSGRNLRRLMS